MAEGGPTYDWYREDNWTVERLDPEGKKVSAIPIALLSLLAFAVVVGVIGNIFFVFMEPPYRVPRIRSLRDQLEEAHPTWYW